MQIKLNPTRIITTHKITTQKTKNKHKTYTKKTATFPTWYKQLYKIDKTIYIYKQNNDTIITHKQPHTTEAITTQIQTDTKNTPARYTDKINLSKKIFNLNNKNKVTYTFYPDTNDPATDTQGLLKIELS